MRYGQLQYYNDELNQWFRIVTFQKNVMDESIRQLNVILTFPIVSIPTYKIGNSLVDRLNSEKKNVDFFHKISAIRQSVFGKQFPLATTKHSSVTNKRI
ncbi:hypothetical protein [Pseudochryseolinea flava]|uniref:Uncharacterized protein n=1 Tax=Pseudochryseolinea flava TaxID=2059302 RepID=A0A364Y4U6_9BACT|nr:hypothetical protein [Pseudochryseolinea flava]RAW02018.1 hypothetical protein DQQ10_05535 [Pseudochryseolinea flava]